MSNAHPPADLSTGDQTDADTTPDLTATPAAATTSTPYNYCCPICDAEYGNELIARIHVTRADDSDHGVHNGLMPETEITVVDETGEAVGTVARHPDEMNPTALSPGDFPSDVSVPNGHVLTVAAHNPEETTRKKIEEYTRDRLADTDVEAPAYRTICDLLNRFYLPHVAGPNVDEDELLDDLKPKQQAIIIARLARPDASFAAIAEMVGSAESYPRQVFERAPHVLERLKTKREDYDDLAGVIKTELSDAAVETLREKGLIENVPISFDQTENEDSSQSEGPSHDDETETSTWGSPTKHHGVVRASPADPVTRLADGDTTNATQDTLSTTNATSPANDSVEDCSMNEQEETTETKPSQTNNENIEPTNQQQSHNNAGTGSHRQNGSTAQPTVADMTANIEDLEEKVAFLRDTVSPVAQPEGPTALLVSFAQRVEEHCEEIRTGDNHS